MSETNFQNPCFDKKGGVISLLPPEARNLSGKFWVLLNPEAFSPAHGGCDVPPPPFLGPHNYDFLGLSENPVLQLITAKSVPNAVNQIQPGAGNYKTDIAHAVDAIQSWATRFGEQSSGPLKDWAKDVIEQFVLNFQDSFAGLNESFGHLLQLPLDQHFEPPKELAQHVVAVFVHTFLFSPPIALGLRPEVEYVVIRQQVYPLFYGTGILIFEMGSNSFSRTGHSARSTMATTFKSIACGRCDGIL